MSETEAGVVQRVRAAWLATAVEGLAPAVSLAVGVWSITVATGDILAFEEDGPTYAQRLVAGRWLTHEPIRARSPACPPDSFSYIVGDGNGGKATGSVTVAVEPVPEVSIADVEVNEGDVEETTEAEFTVTLSAPSSSTVSVDWETSEDTGGEHPADENDFVLASGTLTFDPGETEETITVEVVGDGSSEFDETFLVNLLAAVHAELGKSVGVGTIRDLDLDVS